MGSKPSVPLTPPLPTQPVIYSRVTGLCYAPGTFPVQIDFRNLTQEQRQYYIIRHLHAAGCQYIYITETAILVYTFYPALYSAIFNGLPVMDYTAEAIGYTAAGMPSAPPAEDPK